MGNLGSINKRNIQLLCYIAGSYHISSVGVDKRIAINLLLSIIYFIAKLLVIIILQFCRIIAATNHRIEQYRNTTLGTGLIYISGKVCIKSRFRISMTVRH